MRWISILRYRVWPEVRKAQLLGLFVGGPLLAYLFAVGAGRMLNRDTADEVRYFGTWLQLFGIGLVAWGVRELRLEFNHPTVFAAIRAQASAILHSFSGQHHVALTGVGAVGFAGSLAAGHGRVGGTVEQRLDGLEREIDALVKAAQVRDEKFQKVVSDVRGELSTERQERAEADAQTNRRLASVAVGGLYLEIVGLWWLLFATVATSIPDGVAWIAQLAGL